MAQLLFYMALACLPAWAGFIGGGGGYDGTATSDLEMGDTPYSIDGGTSGIAFDPDNDGVNEVTIDTDGTINLSGTSSYLELAELGAAPGTPADGFLRIYGLTDNKAYVIDDAGVASPWAGFSTDANTYRLAAEVLSRLTACKLLLAWVTPATTETDLSGQGHNATYVGSMTTGDQVQKGNAWSLDFDGTDDILTVADHDDFSFGNGSTDSVVSMGAWVELTSSGITEDIFTKWAKITGSEAAEWVFKHKADRVLAFVARDESANVQPTKETDAASGSAGAWVFVVATYDGAGGATAMNSVTLYVNGVAPAQTATNNGSYVAMENLATLVRVGAEITTDGSAANLMKGDLGVGFISAEELSAQAVWEMYIATRGFYEE